MTQRMKAELPNINTHASPYRDYQVNDVVALILSLPLTDKVIIVGTSLGASNTPVVGAYVYLQNKARIINGIWGFQASIWGAQAGIDTAYPGITPNVQFADLAYSTNPINAGLGAYVWKKSPGNTVTNLYTFDTFDVHPGDGNVKTQDRFLCEMKRVIGA